MVVPPALPQPERPPKSRPVSVRMLTTAGLLAVLLLLAALVAIRVIRGPSLPPPPAEARRLYDNGVAALHRESYATAASLLQDALAAHGQFPLAFARLAQAREGLDEPGLAARAVSSARALVVDRARFSPLELLHLDAITGLVSRDFESAITAYMALEAMDPTRPEFQFELGHVYELDEQPTQALERYERAIELDPLHAPAFVRQGVLLGRQGSVDDALGSLERAEQLYQAAADAEGRAKAVYQRGVLLRDARRLAEAATELERGLVIAETGLLLEQQLRTLEELSVVSTMQGDVERGEALARRAIELAAGKPALLASARLALGDLFLLRDDVGPAESLFVAAEGVAERSGAERTRARSQLALATVSLAKGDPDAATSYAEVAQRFYRTGGYRRETIRAMLILGTARVRRGELVDAAALFESQIADARSLDDSGLLARAHDGLGTVRARQGRYGAALAEHTLSLELHQAIDDAASVAEALLSTGMVLAHLGRGPEARQTLESLANRPDLAESVTSLASRISLVSARVEMGLGDYPKAADHAITALAPEGDIDTRITVEALVVQCVSEARSAGGRARGRCEEARRLAEDLGDSLLIGMSTLASAEERFLARDYNAADLLVRDVLASTTPSDHPEQYWRATLLGERVSERVGDDEAVTRYSSQRDDALKWMRDALGPAGLVTYLARADVAALLQ